LHRHFDALNVHAQEKRR